MNFRAPVGDMYEKFAGKSALGISEEFFDLCVDCAREHYGEDEPEGFSSFRDMFVRPSPASARQYYRNVFVQRHAPVLETLLADVSGANVLDACCGMGYDSILFSLLGAETAGVDISGRRIDIPNAIAGWFRKKYQPLNPSFHNRDLFSFIEENSD